MKDRKQITISFKIVIKLTAFILILMTLFSCSSNNEETINKEITTSSNETIEAERIITAQSINGAVNVSHNDGSRLSVYEGMNFYDGDGVSVLSNSDLTMKIDSDKVIFAEEDTEFHVTATGSEGSSKTEIHLEKGSILINIKNKLNDDETFDIVTQFSSLTVRGTIFRFSIVETGGTKYEVIEVYDGTIWSHLTDSKAELYELTANAGQCVLIRDGKIRDFSIYIFDDQIGLDFYTDPSENINILRDHIEGTALLEIPLIKVPVKSLEKLIQYIEEGEEIAFSKEEINQAIDDRNNYNEQNSYKKTTSIETEDITENDIENSTNDNTPSSPSSDYTISDYSSANFSKGNIDGAYDSGSNTYVISCPINNLDLQGNNGNSNVENATVIYKMAITDSSKTESLSYNDKSVCSLNSNIYSLEDSGTTFKDAIDEFYESILEFSINSIDSSRVKCCFTGSDPPTGIKAIVDMNCDVKISGTPITAESNSLYHITKQSGSLNYLYECESSGDSFTKGDLAFNESDKITLLTEFDKFDYERYIDDDTNAHFVGSSITHNYDTNTKTLLISVPAITLDIRNLTDPATTTTITNANSFNLVYALYPENLYPVFVGYKYENKYLASWCDDKSSDDINCAYHRITDLNSPYDVIDNSVNAKAYNNIEYRYVDIIGGEKVQPNKVIVKVKCDEYFVEAGAPGINSKIKEGVTINYIVPFDGEGNILSPYFEHRFYNGQEVPSFNSNCYDYLISSYETDLNNYAISIHNN